MADKVSTGEVERLNAGLDQRESFVRRTDGTAKGAGSFASVVQYDVQSDLKGTGITYQGSGANEGAFLIERQGVYAVTVSARGQVARLVIHTGAAPNNTVNGVTSRAFQSVIAAANDDSNAHWVGPVATGEFIWVHYSGTIAGTVDENQITIVRLS